jgi:hypothetical protein
MPARYQRDGSGRDFLGSSDRSEGKTKAMQSGLYLGMSLFIHHHRTHLSQRESHSI